MVFVGPTFLWPRGTSSNFSHMLLARSLWKFRKVAICCDSWEHVVCQSALYNTCPTNLALLHQAVPLAHSHLKAIRGKYHFNLIIKIIVTCRDSRRCLVNIDRPASALDTDSDEEILLREIYPIECQASVALDLIFASMQAASLDDPGLGLDADHCITQ